MLRFVSSRHVLLVFSIFAKPRRLYANENAKQLGDENAKQLGDENAKQLGDENAKQLGDGNAR